MESVRYGHGKTMVMVAKNFLTQPDYPPTLLKGVKRINKYLRQFYQLKHTILKKKILYFCQQWVPKWGEGVGVVFF